MGEIGEGQRLMVKGFDKSEQIVWSCKVLAATH